MTMILKFGVNMAEMRRIVLMIGIAFILGTAGVNLIFPVSNDILQLAKYGFSIGCFAVFMATVSCWFD